MTSPTSRQMMVSSVRSLNARPLALEIRSICVVMVIVWIHISGTGLWITGIHLKTLVFTRWVLLFWYNCFLLMRTFLVLWWVFQPFVKRTRIELTFWISLVPGFVMISFKSYKPFNFSLVLSFLWLQLLVWITRLPSWKKTALGKLRLS